MQVKSGACYSFWIVVMAKFLEQGFLGHGLWYRIYQVKEDITFRIVTGSTTVEPADDPCRTWFGIIHKGEDRILEFENVLRTDENLSFYVDWRLGSDNTEMMYFQHKDLDAILEIIKSARLI